MPNNMIDFIKGGDRLLRIAEKCIDFVEQAGLRKNRTKAGVVLHKNQYQLLAPIPRPPSLFTMAVNNRRAFRASLAKNPSGNPFVVMKAPASVIGDEEAIFIPSHIKHAGPELEFAVVVGKPGQYIAKDKAFDYVFGYTMFNDMTAYDLLDEDVLVHGPYPHVRDPRKPVTEPTGEYNYGVFRAKSQYGFTPIGPAIVTKGSIDPVNVEMWCSVNGETIQHGRPNEYFFSIADVLTFLSTIIPLTPGDIVSMGRVSPEHRDLKDGDLLECYGEGIGTLRNSIRVRHSG
jgi:2-keto-4-pentenoate hydratase/2-oxohepta-3-ene-1,7-dioic acid hydratase in catechol pathway